MALKLRVYVLKNGDKSKLNYHINFFTGSPNAMDLSCTYHNYSQGDSQYCLITVHINVTDILTNNQETEVSYVSITVTSSNGNEYEQTHNFSILPTTEVDAFNATFYYKCPTNEQIIVNFTVFDKCGQQSLSSMISCIFWEGKIIVTNNSCIATCSMVKRAL